MTTDYTPEEKTRVLSFYRLLPTENYFDEFFNVTGITGKWINRLLLPNQFAPRVNPFDKDRNSILALGLKQKIVDMSMGYGSSTLINVATNEPSAFETFQVVAEFLEPNVDVGFVVHRSLLVSLFQSETGRSSTYSVRFDPRLHVPANAVRIEEIYAPNPPKVYDVDKVLIPPLPVQVDFFFGATRMVSYKISGYVAEEDDAPPAQAPAQPQPVPLPASQPMFLGMKLGGAFYGIGLKQEFVRFTSARQVRAAVLLHVSKLFTFASIWRVIFAMMNSTATAVALGVEGAMKKAELSLCLDRVAKSIANFEFIINVTPEDGELFTDLAEITDTATATFTGWNTDPTRTKNCRVQALRICRNAFVPTASFADEAKKDVELNAERLATLKTIVDACTHEVSELRLNADVEGRLNIENQQTPLTRFQNAFAEKVKSADLIKADDKADGATRRLLAVLDTQRRRAQADLAQTLRSISPLAEDFVRQSLTNIMIGQQLLDATALITNCIVELSADETQRAVVVAPLRSSERVLAQYTARFLIELLPKERRTRPLETERYADLLQKVADGNVDRWQVPIPSIVDFVEFVDERFAAMNYAGEAADFSTLVVVLPIFYTEERRYFAEIVNIEWTAKDIDTATFKNVVLDQRDRERVIALLKISNAQMDTALAEYDRMQIDLEPQYVFAAQEVETIVKRIRQDFLDAAKYTGGKTYNLFALLRRALRQTDLYFEVAPRYERTQKLEPNPLAYEAIKAAEESAFAIMRILVPDTQVPVRPPSGPLRGGDVRDDNLDDFLRNLNAAQSRMRAIARIGRKAKFAFIGPNNNDDDDDGNDDDNQMQVDEADFVETKRNIDNLVGEAYADVWKILAAYPPLVPADVEKRKTVVRRYVVKNDVNILTRLSALSVAGQQHASSDYTENFADNPSLAEFQKLYESAFIVSVIVAESSSIGAEEIANIRVRLFGQPSAPRKLLEVFSRERVDAFLSLYSKSVTDSFVTLAERETNARRGKTAADEFLRQEAAYVFIDRPALQQRDRQRVVDIGEAFSLTSSFGNIATDALRALRILSAQEVVGVAEIQTVEELTRQVETVYRSVVAIAEAQPFLVVKGVRGAFVAIAQLFDAVKKKLPDGDRTSFESVLKQIEAKRLKDATVVFEAARANLNDAIKETQKAITEADKLTGRNAALTSNLQKVQAEVEKEVAKLESDGKKLRERIETVEKTVPTTEKVEATLASVKEQRAIVAAEIDATSDLVENSKQLAKDIADLEARDRTSKKEQVKVEARIEDLAAITTRYNELYAAVQNMQQQYEDLSELLAIDDVTEAENLAARTMANAERAVANLRQLAERAKAFRTEIDTYQKIVDTDAASITQIQAELLLKAARAQQNAEEFTTLKQNIAFVTQSLKLAGGGDNVMSLARRLQRLEEGKKTTSTTTIEPGADKPNPNKRPNTGQTTTTTPGPFSLPRGTKPFVLKPDPDAAVPQQQPDSDMGRFVSRTPTLSFDSCMAALDDEDINN